MMCNIVDTPLNELRVDLPVMVVFDAVSDSISLPRFKPVR